MTVRKKPTTMEYALLALVSLKKSSGYDIQRIFADTPMRQYSASPGSIYPALERLNKRGLLTSALDSQHSTRRRRLYKLTPTGNSVLDAWLAEEPTIEEIQSDIRTTLLRFSFMENRRNRREVLRYLKQFGEHLRTYLRDLESRRQSFREMQALHAYLAMDNGISSVRAHIRWVESATKTLQSGKWPNRK